MIARTRLAQPRRVPADAPADGDGIALGQGPVAVDVYIDFLCPFCRQFEQRDGAAIDELAAQSLISLVYHPVGFLDRLSTTRYSTRAAASSGCASDGGLFREYVSTLFAEQPPENTSGLSDEELVQLGLQTGLDESFGTCVSAGAYIDWARYMTELATARGVTGTPAVYVGGTAVQPSVQAIAAVALAELG